MLWQLIMAWQPCLVSAMDSSTVVQAAGAAAGTVIPIAVAAAAVGAVARVCATSEKQDARGNEAHCLTPAQHQQSEVQAEHHPDVSSSTPGCSPTRLLPYRGAAALHSPMRQPAIGNAAGGPAAEGVPDVGDDQRSGRRDLKMAPTRKRSHSDVMLDTAKPGQL